MPSEEAELDAWVRVLTRALDLDPSAVPAELLLDVTREAAHGVIRPAGPLTTFMLGLAVGRGMPIDDAVAAVQAQLTRW